MYGRQTVVPNGCTCLLPWGWQVMVKQENTKKNQDFEPQIQFDKHEEGITYTLSLKENETSFLPMENHVEILLDEPGWLIVNKGLGRWRDIGPKKLDPTLRNNT